MSRQALLPALLALLGRSPWLVRCEDGDGGNGWDSRVVAPPRWPEVFRARLLLARSGGRLGLSDLYYDFQAGRSLHVIQVYGGVLGEGCCLHHIASADA